MQNPEFRLKSKMDKTEPPLVNNNAVERLTRASDSERKDGYTVRATTINEMVD